METLVGFAVVIGFFALLFGGLYLGLRLGIIKASPEALAAKRAFFEELGYRHKGLPDGPPEAQMTFAGNGHYVRPILGRGTLQFIEHSDESGSSADWYMASTDARAHFQIADRRLTSALRSAAVAVVTRQQRSWSGVFPFQVATGDPGFDARFLLLSDDPPAAIRALGTPAGRELLSLLARCPVVDLRVDDKFARFSDPEEANIHAVLGGTTGILSAGASMVPYFRARVAVHQAIADLLVAARDAAAAA